MLACDIYSRIRNSHITQDRRYLEYLAVLASPHVARGFLTQVHQSHEVQFDDETDRTGVLIGKWGVMANSGVVDEQVESTRQCNGVLPESLPELAIK
jgi:hypothetical protein